MFFQKRGNERKKERSLLVEKVTIFWTAVQLAVQLRGTFNPGTGVSGIHVIDQIQQRPKKKDVHGNTLNNEKKMQITTRQPECLTLEELLNNLQHCP